MFFNPRSGVRLPPAEREALRNTAREAGIEVIDLDDGVDVSSIVRRQIDEGRRLFIAAGGDGTINTVVQSVIHTEAILGVVPVGTIQAGRQLGPPAGDADRGGPHPGSHAAHHTEGASQ